MDSIFTKIIKGEIPCYKVIEDERHIAFLDIAPNTPGHTLCVPKKQIDKLFDLPEADYSALMAFCRRVALALEKALPCNRVGMTIIGLEVPHAHVHLIPINSMSDMTFQSKATLSKEDFQNILLRIKEQL